MMVMRSAASRSCRWWRRPSAAHSMRTTTAAPQYRALSVGSGSGNGRASNEGEARMHRPVDPKHFDKTRQLDTPFLLNPQENGGWQVVHHDHFQHVRLPQDWEARLAHLQTRMGVRFHNILHLKTALVHHGALSSSQIPQDVVTHRLSNRSLEFLGDSVLGMAVASFVFQSQPHFQEGQLTRLKGILVNNETLSNVAEHDLQIHDLVVVAQEYNVSTPSNEAWYHKGRTTIQAGAVESLIAAVYVDQGLDSAVRFVNQVILPSAIKYATEEHTFQPVVELQELLQAHGYGHPTYRRVAAPSTDQVLQVELFVRDEYVLTGKGSSYKDARINAAHAGYVHFAAFLSEDQVD